MRNKEHGCEGVHCRGRCADCGEHFTEFDNPDNIYVADSKAWHRKCPERG